MDNRVNDIVSALNDGVGACIENGSNEVALVLVDAIALILDLNNAVQILDENVGEAVDAITTAEDEVAALHAEIDDLRTHLARQTETIKYQKEFPILKDAVLNTPDSERRVPRYDETDKQDAPTQWHYGFPFSD